MKMPTSSEFFLFGEFRLDRAGGGLFRRDDHGVFAPVTIGSRALDLLAALIERRGDVVAKEEIMAAVWPKMTVEEHNLFVQISALRAILDKKQSAQSCIQTVAGRGYRFIAPVARCAGGMDSSPGPHERLPLFPSDGAKPPFPLAEARPPEPQPPSISSAERRQLTVMVCDLVGSVGLAATRDLEDWRDLVKAYLDEASKLATALGGHVLTRLGNGLTVLFGYPEA